MKVMNALEMPEWHVFREMEMGADTLYAFWMEMDAAAEARTDDGEEMWCARGQRELWRAAVRHVASHAFVEEADAVLADVVSWLGPAPAGAAPAVAAVPPVPAQDASLLLEVEAVQRDSEHIAAVLSEQVRVLTHMQDTVFVLQDSVAQLQERLAALHPIAGQGRST